MDKSWIPVLIVAIVALALLLGFKYGPLKRAIFRDGDRSVELTATEKHRGEFKATSSKFEGTELENRGSKVEFGDTESKDSKFKFE